tara:strand:- start:713 stop:1315 length:603 start_codon:yes stop_codon:yes gene_type:complete
MNTLKNWKLILFVVSLLSGCAGQRGDVSFLLDTGASLSVVSQSVPIVAGAEVVRTAYKSSSTTDFLVDTSFQATGTGLLVQGLPIAGSSVLAAHSAYNAYEAKDIRQFKWSTVIQIAGFATGNFVTGFCVAAVVDITQAILNDQHYKKELLKFKEQKEKERILDQLYTQDSEYILALNNQSKQFWDEHGQYAVVFIINYK